MPNRAPADETKRLISSNSGLGLRSLARVPSLSPRTEDR